MADRSAKTKKKSSILMLIAAVLCLGVIVACAFIIITDKSDVVMNPFDYADMSFEGDTGSGRAVFTVKEPTEDEKLPFTAADFTINRTEGLYEGDTVSVKIDRVPEGYKYTEKVRNYTVSGLNTCIEAKEDVTDDVIASLRETADPVMEKHGSDPENASLTEYDLTDVILASEGGNKNHIYLVYSASFRNTKGQTEDTVMAVKVDDVILRKSTGEVVCGKASIFGEWLNVVGGTGKEITFGYVPGFSNAVEAADAAKEDAGEDAVITVVYNAPKG